MAGKIDVVLLQSVKGLGNKNDVVSVAVAYAKNVLFPKGQAKMADAIAKNNLAQKKEQQQKHNNHVEQIREEIQLYASAKEPLLIKRKVTPGGKLYEKVHETDVRDAMKQWNISLPTDIVIQKNTWEDIGEHEVILQYNNKKSTITFLITETY